MEFRKTRRTNQDISQKECEEILQRSTAGVLAVLGDGEYPYAVPLSFVYYKGLLYFHCAKEGHKLDAIQRSRKASFCVIDQDKLVPEEYTTYYRSVITFGQAELVSDPREQHDALLLLAEKYCPADTPAHREEKSTGTQGYTAVIRLTVEHMTGKEGKALAQQRRAEGSKQ
ncbi:pyridoxamine 5'-phosphate oxidase family protein [Neglectibacter caecimuris]|uniref:pyridoxamine 5'-phosphate oxidase family protein n=1 Tax=Neglectibacter caecimuris TaxID=3093658 RepID=UPI002AC94E38|nr:pyridoxamine 5'-phosphate oxidase family protein [Neglectibacter sp. M00184]